MSYDSGMTTQLYKTGVDRAQASLLPARVEDYVGRDNPVRAIELYVGSLDLVALKFRHAERVGGAGQPPYDPGHLLKLYLYGYLNRVRSSRRLAVECMRNLELIWLLQGLTPRYRTISDFRKDNWAALKAANRDFVLVARALELVAGELVAVDGAFFHGDASKASIATETRLAKRLAAVDREIEDYRATLEANDAAEDAAEAVASRSGPSGGAGGGAGGGGGEGSGVALSERLAALLAKRATAAADLARLEASGESQLSKTDPDARLLSKSGQVVAGYNVQVAVDAKHKLIVASEVVNDGNDSGQLHAMAQAAKQALAQETLTVVADGGYFNGTTLKACEEDGIAAYVPPPERTARMKGQGRFSHEDFTYDAEADVYRCPAGALLKPTKTPKRNGDRLEIRYSGRKAVCADCPLRARCLTRKMETRTVQRWVHEDVLERHRARMAAAGAWPMRRRAELAEHPFGTLKCRAGYRHFLVRGFDKVRGEWSLMALCYNFARVLNILGFDRFRARLAEAIARVLAAILGCAATFLALARLATRQSGAIRLLLIPT